MGQQSKCPIDLDRSVNGATQFFNRGSRGISLSGVWGGAPVANGFWKIFDGMVLVSSTVYHVRKTAHDFEPVEDVVI